MQTDILALFFFQEDVGQLGRLLMMLIVGAHFLKNRVGGIQPFLTQMIRERGRKRTFLNLLGHAQQDAVRTVAIVEQQQQVPRICPFQGGGQQEERSGAAGGANLPKARIEKLCFLKTEFLSGRAMGSTVRRGEDHLRHLRGLYAMLFKQRFTDRDAVFLVAPLG